MPMSLCVVRARLSTLCVRCAWPLVVALPVVVALPLLPAPALAAPKDPGKAAADDAALAFKEGRFHDAAEGFEKAFALGPDKIVRLRNAGRAWEEAGKLEYARTKFQRYLDKAPPGPERAEVVGRLADLEARMAAVKSPVVVAPEPLPASTSTPAPDTPAPAAAEHAPDAQVTVPAPAPDAVGHGRQITGWTLVGAGAALAAGGAVWLVMTQSRSQVVEDGVNNHLYSTQALAESDRARIRDNQLGAIALGSVGVAAGVVGAIVLATSPSAVASSHARALPVAAVTPWAAGGGAGLALSGQF